MTQEELKKYLDPSFITWESIKLTLLSPQNTSYVLGRNVSDDAILLKSVFIFCPPSDTSGIKPYNITIPANQFYVLLTQSNGNNTPQSFGTTLTGTPVHISESSIGTIFITSLNTVVYSSEMSTYLVFQIN